MFPSPFVACAKFPSVYVRYDKHHQLSSYLKVEYHESIFHHFSAHLIATASKLTTTKSFVDSCLPCATPKLNSITFKRFLGFLDSLCTAVCYLLVAQCGRSILGSRGRAICILIRHHLEHAILLSKKRVNKGKERMTSVPLSRELSPVVISYATSYLHCVTLCP